MPAPLFILDIGPDGAVAVHPDRIELPSLVAPIPDDKKTQDLNTLRQPLIVIGCMRLPDRSFEFDSSFIGPGSAGRLPPFSGLFQGLKQPGTARPPRFPPPRPFCP